MAIQSVMDPATEIQLSIGLVTVFVVTTLSVVVGCWCGNRRKKQQYQSNVAEKGEISDNHGSGGREKQQVSLMPSLLNERTYSEANDYAEQRHKAVESLSDKRPRTNNHASPTTRAVQSSIPLTEDGYATLEPGDDTNEKIPEEYVPPLRSENQTYDEVNDGVPLKDSNEDPTDVTEGNAEDVVDYDYAEPFWEPADKEDQLISQLYSTLKLQRIPAQNVELKEQLGSGQFGTVYRGLLRKEREHEGGEEGPTLEVAVKSLRKKASEEERVMFLKEAAIMGQFNHPYVVKILGIVDDEPMKIVEELMPKGDLLHHLISLRPKEGESKCKELGSLLLSYSRQVAVGMICLHMKEFIHRDLAARNILVSEDGLCKIADFGLSRSLHHEAYYKSHGGKIPVKWTAPEALHYNKYSRASDLWSYGCLLYEIWSLGCKPFHDVTNTMQVMELIESGYRLPPPPGCPRYIYQIMINCWNPEPSSRKPFCGIVVELQHPDFQILKWSDKDKADCSPQAMILGSPIEEGVSLFKDLQRTYV